MSSASSRTQIFRFPNFTPTFRDLSSLTRSLRKMLKSIGDKLSPCFTPWVDLNHSVKSPFEFIREVVERYSDFMAR